MSQRLYSSIKNLRKGGGTAMKAKIIFSVLAVLALAAGLVPGVAYAGVTDGTMPGSFTLGNVAPALEDVEIYEANYSTESLDPLDEYDIRVTVSDANSMADIDHVTLDLYYDAAGNSDPSTRPTTGNSQSCILLEWSTVTGWTIDPESDTTWVLGNCSTPPSGSIIGTYHFVVKVGKVAHNTKLTVGDKWHIYAEVYDTAGLNDNFYKQTIYMNWYGEILNVTDTIHWDNVQPSSVNNSLAEPMQVTYIANGNWNMSVSGKSPWVNGANSSTLVTSDAPGATQFSLRFSYNNSLANSVHIPVYNAYVVFYSAGVITPDVIGVLMSSNNCFLSIGSGLVAGIYSGEIYGKIENRQ